MRAFADGLIDNDEKVTYSKEHINIPCSCRTFSVVN